MRFNCQYKVDILNDMTIAYPMCTPAWNHNSLALKGKGTGWEGWLLYHDETTGKESVSWTKE